MGDGETKEETISDVKSAFKEFVIVSLKNGDDIVEPNIKYYSKRINITLPSNILEEIDLYASQNHISRSELIQKATIDYIHIN